MTSLCPVDSSLASPLLTGVYICTCVFLFPDLKQSQLLGVKSHYSSASKDFCSGLTAYCKDSEFSINRAVCCLYFPEKIKFRRHLPPCCFPHTCLSRMGSSEYCFDCPKICDPEGVCKSGAVSKVGTKLSFKALKARHRL